MLHPGASISTLRRALERLFRALNAFTGQDNRDPSSHDFQKDANTACIVQVIDLTHKIREGAHENTHRLAWLQFVARQVHYAVLVASITQCLNDTSRRRRGSITLHYKPTDPIGPVDAAPLVARQVELREKIPRKERCKNDVNLARVTTRLLSARQENRKTLILQMRNRHRLSVRQTLHSVPSRLLLQVATSEIRPSTPRGGRLWRPVAHAAGKPVIDFA